ncbi:MAG TPA: 2-C-methyl-D-erythritol 4-phosphate cytidylyltransferase [Candidatus Omnitrophica bacterium]|nr:2-C-methyl-D-erythritol 4-phosphate cytidylyltransferase [Candidatus Omnitrophota bacterium]
MITSSVILLSAGVGRRLKKNYPKGLLKLNNKPLFCYSLETFNLSNIFTTTCIVVPRGYEDKFKKYIKKYQLHVDLIVTGGRYRVDSMINGFCSLNNCDYVFIHDCARPFVSRKLILRLWEAVKKYKAVIPVRHISFTVKKCLLGFVDSTIDRRDLYEVQTPQVFSYSILKSAIEDYLTFKDKPVICDDSFLVELAGKRVKTVEGDVFNFKITYPQDLELAKKLIL